jgi:predicted nucleic acid-binding protein
MSVYVDTSGLLAMMDSDDVNHGAAAAAWREIIGAKEWLVTTNYVTVEALSVTQRRLGMKAVRALSEMLLLKVSVEWVEPELHHAALGTFLAADRRGLSLVDCASFVFMLHQGITKVFTTDRHFSEQGFEVLP